MSGLEGDMGVSSERTDGFEGVEGTGTAASAQGRTDGESPTDPPAARDDDNDDREDDGAADKPDQTSPATNVDRTVGEVQPDEVAHKHSFDPDRNPGH